MGEDMYNLLAKHFSGQADEAEKAAVQQWIAADTANEADYRLLEKMWHASATQHPITFDTEAALQQVTAHIEALETTGKRTPVITLQRAVAVAALLVISLAIWWFAASNSRLNLVQATTSVQQVALPDGSTIWLRQGAVLQYPNKFDDDERHVKLTGEAFFDIAKNKEQPFVINTRETQVKVVGTSFSIIEHQNDSVEVIVKTGVVQFSALSTTGQVQLVAGEKGLYYNNKLTEQQNTDENFNAWQSKQLVFKNASLAHVIATLSDYYKAQIDCRHIEATELAQTTVTVSFNNQTLSAALQDLSLITPYEAKAISNTHFELIKK